MDIQDLIAMFLLFGFPPLLFFLFKWKKMMLEHQGNSGLSSKAEQKMDLLIEQNEDLREEVEQMKFLLGIGKKESKSLDIERYRQRNEKLTDYEKEQIRIDNQNKFKY